MIDYASPEARMKSYGMPTDKSGNVFVPLGTSARGECCVCWGTGDKDCAQAHPFSRNVILEDQEFLRNPFLRKPMPNPDLAVLFEIPDSSEPVTMGQVLSCFRHALKEERARTVQESNCRVHWANFRGYSAKVLKDKDEEVPFWASHVYIEILPPPITHGPKGGLRISAPMSHLQVSP